MSKPQQTQPTALEISEANLAAMREERDLLKGKLEEVLAKQAGDAFALAFSEMPTDYVERVIFNVNTRLNDNQRLRLRALLDGLVKANAKLADGKPVYLPVHAVLWVLEQLKFKPAA